MRLRALFVVFQLLCLLGAGSPAAQAADMPVISRVEIAKAADDPSEYLILYITQGITYKSFKLDNPDRLVLDMPVVEWKAGSGLPYGYKGQLLKNIRYGRYNATTSRVVLDMAGGAYLNEVSLRNQGEGQPFLMVLQIIPEGVAPTAAKEIQVTEQNGTASYQPEAEAERISEGSPDYGRRVDNSPQILQVPGRREHPPLTTRQPVEAEVEETLPGESLPPSDNNNWAEEVERQEAAHALPAGLGFEVAPVPVPKPGIMTRKPTVVIDAGHGGRDPGASGASGTQEKIVTLEYARALRFALLKTGLYNVVMTRDDDRFILLRERLAIGRRAKGDIFISIHADSAENHDTRGLSIYTLSETASDKEAEDLAARENKVDIIYGMNLNAESQDVTEILIDLAQRETKNKSTKLADFLVEGLGRVVQLLPNTHRFAGFAVLKAPDVPSVLVETGFLSNSKDEALLKSTEYRDRLVGALVQGVGYYFNAQHYWD